MVPLHYPLTWGLLLSGQLYRYVRRSSVTERESTRWPVAAVLTMVLGFLVWMIAVGASGAVPEGTWLANLLTMLPAPAFAIGLVAPRVLAIDRVLRMVLLVGLWLVAVGLVAWGAFAVLGDGSTDAAAWLAAITTAFVAVAAATGARRLADRLVFGRRADPLHTLAELGERLAGSIDPRAVPTEIVRTATAALRLRGARLDADFGPPVQSGTPFELDEPATSRFPIVYSGEQIGELAVHARAGDAALTAHDRAVLAQVCAQAGPALHSARAVAELLEARSRIVFAREEERKRLRRDLHDDLAPTFAGLGMSAAAVEAFSRTGDERATDAATRLVSGLHAATRQLREIAYDLRPPVLDDRGLVAAVEERVLAPGSSPRIRLETPVERLVLPAAVESAALRIVQEAVANVRRHAAASDCLIVIAVEAQALRVTVSDDGRGIAPAAHRGVGLRSMAERAAEVGGELSIARATPGTVVSARLPLALPDAGLRETAVGRDAHEL